MATVQIPVWRRGKVVAHAVVLDDDFTRRVLAPRHWCLVSDGYPASYQGGTCQYMHDLVYAHYHGDKAGLDVDHEDRNRLNCTPGNLRALTRSFNLANSPKRRRNRSGFKGVSFCKEQRRWRAQIMVNYRGIFLGRFVKKEDAARAVNEAYRLHFPGVRPPNPEAELA